MDKDRFVLVVILTVLSLSLGWFVPEGLRVAARRRAVDRVCQLNGLVGYDCTPATQHGWPLGRPPCIVNPPGPEWLQSVLGPDFFCRTTDVYLPGPDVGDPELRLLSDFREVQHLTLRKTNISDHGLLQVPRLPRLIDLNLAETAISDLGLERVGDFTTLESLLLNGTRVSDRGLARLAGLKHLSILTLENNEISDDGLALLSGLSGLETLDLSGTKITSAGLKNIRGLSNLRELFLRRTAVDDAGLRYLADLGSLERLDISESAVAGHGLVELRHLSHLSILSLAPRSSTDLTPLRSLPQLKRIDLSGRHISDASLISLFELPNVEWIFLEQTETSFAGRLVLMLAMPNTEVRCDADPPAQLVACFDLLERIVDFVASNLLGRTSNP